jgi:flagellar biosynthesis protein FlhF
MIVKRVVAGSMREALKLAEKECGAGALILQTRVTSAGAEVVTARPAMPVAPAAPRKAQQAHRDISPGFAPVAARALAAGLSDVVVRTLARALAGLEVRTDQPGDPALPGVTARVLGSLIPSRALTDLPRCVALVGPTGVGKTTTVAKLAARATREEGKTAVLFTLDLHRISAVEQIRAFADLLSVPLEVIFTPADLRRALERHRDTDRIYIDTAGRSPRDSDALRQMGALFRDQPVERILCLPAAARRVDLDKLAAAYEPLLPRGLAITKWDETDAPGEVVCHAIENAVPLALVTDGQAVPGNLRPAQPHELAAELLGVKP